MTRKLNPLQRDPTDLPPEVRDRELAVAREIAESFLTAGSPLEVYRTALARVTPIVGATFASVFLRDEADPQLMRLACAQNWPQRAARFLGEMRIREGRGPTGRAVSHGKPVEVANVFADPAMEEWWEPARELGFVSMIALPLAAEDSVFGALSFYFRERQDFDEAARALLAVVAHQLAVTADRANLIAELRSSNVQLERENEALLLKISQAESALQRARASARELSPRSDRRGPGPESS